MVSGHRKTEGRNNEERDFRFWPRVKWTEIQKMIRAVFGLPPRLFTIDQHQLKVTLLHSLAVPAKNLCKSSLLNASKDTTNAHLVRSNLGSWSNHIEA